MLNLMRPFYFIRLGTRVLAALACMLAAAPAAAQTPGPAGFTVLVRSRPVGNEQVTVQRTPGGWTVTSNGRMGPPIDMTLRTFRIEYDADWKPASLSFDATLRGQAGTIDTTVSGSSARSVLTPAGGAASEQTVTIDPKAILFANPMVAPFEAVAARLTTAAAGTIIPFYQPPAGSFTAEVGESTDEQIKTVDRVIHARRTHLTFNVANGSSIAMEVWGDETGRLLRVSIPSQALDFARDDIASVGARIVTMARPNDEDVRIPSTGFSLAGTISKPQNAAGRLPAVLLVAGTGLEDRDEIMSGIPIFGQLANALADAGFLVLRYDKRGTGQSGGRVEAATLTDYAEDAKAAVKLLDDRDDVDDDRIAVVGYGEGGWIALLTARKNGRVATVALLATAGVSGTDLNLSEVTRALERSNRPDADRQATIDLQQKIQQAVITGKGWDQPGITDAVRRQADTPYFKSFLMFDPAETLKDVRQPILVIQGALDTELAASHAQALADLANARKKAVPAKVAVVPGVDHLLAPSTTDDAGSSGQAVSSAVTSAVIDWLTATNQTLD
jgi:pimeloyl-ACP methyl ester carboxylesterase